MRIQFARRFLRLISAGKIPLWRGLLSLKALAPPKGIRCLRLHIVRAASPHGHIRIDLRRTLTELTSFPRARADVIWLLSSLYFCLQETIEKSRPQTPAKRTKCHNQSLLGAGARSPRRAKADGGISSGNSGLMQGVMRHRETLDC